MENNFAGNGFRENLLKQIKEYLDGKITKEEYYEMAESFYSEYAKTYENPAFHKYFLDTVADACPVVRITEQVAKEKLQRGDHGGSWSGFS